MRRRLECLWRRSELNVDREMYVQQCKMVNELIYQSKMRYYSGIIEDSQLDQKRLFGVVSSLLHVKMEIRLPSYNDSSRLAEAFADFFTDKTSKFRYGLQRRRREAGSQFPD